MPVAIDVRGFFIAMSLIFRAETAPTKKDEEIFK